jgi:hypothetical protein
MRQLPLAVRLRDVAIFDTFEPGPNGAVIAVLADPAATGPAAWIWGPEGSGKSHLLQAACAAHPGAAYLPADELLPAGPGVLEGWDERPLVCIDDVDRLAGRQEWELAAFALFNRLWERGGRLVVSASADRRRRALRSLTCRAGSPGAACSGWSRSATRSARPRYAGGRPTAVSSCRRRRPLTCCAACPATCARCAAGSTSWTRLRWPPASA